MLALESVFAEQIFYTFEHRWYAVNVCVCALDYTGIELFIVLLGICWTRLDRYGIPDVGFAFLCAQRQFILEN